MRWPTITIPRAWPVIVGLALMAALMWPVAATADETVMVCDIYGNHVASRPAATRGIRATSRCPGNAGVETYTSVRPPGGMAIWTVRSQPVPYGRGVHWAIRAPNGLIISSVDVPHMYSYGLDDGRGWGGALYWDGGNRTVRTFDRESRWSSSGGGGPSFTWPASGTRYFGWRVRCRARRCTNGGNHWLSMELLELGVHELNGPRVAFPDGLWHATGWIRGVWPLHFIGDSPSGVCSTGSALNGQPGPGVVVKRDPTVWHQCASPPVDAKVDTAQYGQGPLPLTVTAIDAADRSATYTRTVDVDNQRPTVWLSGPSDAPSSGGTQYVHAIATAGPSGVAWVACSVDHAPAHFYAGAGAAVPVQGVGIHHVTCLSASNSRDAAGVVATSAPSSWTLAIRSPSVTTLSFVRIKRSLHRSRRRVSVRQLRIRYGHVATISGWLGTTAGVALGGQQVRVLTAPDDRRGHFRMVAAVRTGSDGTWRLQLHPGPSRLVMATYGGGPIVEPSVSRTDSLVVSAGIRLHIHPRSVHWGGRVRIRGVVRGGHIPPSGEIVFLWAGWKHGSTNLGRVYTRPNGTFRTAFTFWPGHGHQRYTMWASSGRETDYPFLPARSNRVSIRVGP